MGVVDLYDHPWTCYMSLRLIIGILDYISDLLQSFRLFYNQEPLFGGITIAFPFLAVLAATFNLLPRLNLVKNVSKTKRFQLIFLHTNEIYAGFFESGPTLVLQLIIVWRGILKGDLHKFFSGKDYGSLDWCFGLNAVMSILFSFTSLVITTIHYNRQAEIPAAKFFSAVLTTIFSICCRVFMLSMLFASLPGPATGMVLVMYFINLISYKTTGGSEENWNCIIYSYYSLLTPAGYARWIGSAKSTTMNGTLGASEIERAKINQDSLFKRVQVSYLLHTALTISMIIVYSVLVEVLVLGKDDSLSVLQLVTNKRAVVHTPPTFLFLLTFTFMGWHFQQVKKLRDGTRAWYTISGNGEATHTSIIRQPPFNPTAPIADPPPPYQQQLLPHTPNLHNYPKVLPTIPNSPHNVAVNIPNIGTIYGNYIANNSPCTDTNKPSPSTYIPNSITCNETVQPSPTHIDDFLENHEARPHGTYRNHEDGCVTCELFLEGTSFLSKTTGKNYVFTSSVSCTDKNVIYLVTCLNDNCGKQYVGKSIQEMRKRHYGHRREIELKSSPLGKHFSDVCGYIYFQLQIIDQIKPRKGEDSEKLKQELLRREGYWQHELMTFEPWGLNTRDELNGAGIASPFKSPIKKKH